MIIWTDRLQERPPRDVRILVFWRGKSYVGTYNGRYHILVLDSDFNETKVQVDTEHVTFWAYILPVPKEKRK